MARPSLKNYLSTGKIEVIEEQPAKPADPADPAKPASTASPASPAKPTKQKKTETKTPKAKTRKNLKERLPEEKKSNALPDFLSSFAPEDLATWEGMFASGANLKEEKANLVALREFFRDMDRVRYTLYVLDAEGAPLRTVRSAVGIREPFILFLLWDDEGAATVYKP